jgi:hypothetical protein
MFCEGDDINYDIFQVSINIPRKHRTKSPAARSGGPLSLPPSAGRGAAPAALLPAPPSSALAKLNIQAIQIEHFY